MPLANFARNYIGLAQTGAWGCFDEFNRISVEVLSVVSVQVKTVLDAIKFKKEVRIYGRIYYFNTYNWDVYHHEPGLRW